MFSKDISVRLDEATAILISEFASEHGMSKSGVVKVALSYFFEHKKEEFSERFDVFVKASRKLCEDYIKSVAEKYSNILNVAKTENYINK